MSGANQMPKKSSQTIVYNEQAVRKVAKTKHEKQTDYMLKDAHGGIVPGLILTCYPSGTASYSVRFTTGGKRRRESIGQWGVIELGDARTKALAVAAGAAADVDILAKQAKDASRLTLQQLWDKRAELETARAAKTMHEYGRSLKLDILPKLGSRLAAEITADELADLLQEVEDRSTHAARHCKVALSSLYRWGQKRRLVKVNPLAGLGFNTPGKARRRVLSDTEMIRLWRAIDETEAVTPTLKRIIRLAILTGQRNKEVAGMEPSELKGLDTATPRWVIPGHRMKRKSEDQHVPLSKQAAEIAREALEASSNGVHVFEGSTHGRVGGKWRQGHVANDTVSRAMAKAVTNAKLDDVHLHDMRKCLTTWLAEHGHATSEVLDAILHHGRKGVTGTHYNFALYEKQVRGALQTWADHIDALTKGGNARGNVVELVSAAR